MLLVAARLGHHIGRDRPELMGTRRSIWPAACKERVLRPLPPVSHLIALGSGQLIPETEPEQLLVSLLGQDWDQLAAGVSRDAPGRPGPSTALIARVSIKQRRWAELGPSRTSDKLERASGDRQKSH